MMAYQQLRPEEERNLPDWQLMALDRQRAEEDRNRAENPALWKKMREIEAKLDRLLAALTSPASS
jgi:hypothetical protein